MFQAKLFSLFRKVRLLPCKLNSLSIKNNAILTRPRSSNVNSAMIKVSAIYLSLPLSEEMEMEMEMDMEEARTPLSYAHSYADFPHILITPLPSVNHAHSLFEPLRILTTPTRLITNHAHSPYH